MKSELALPYRSRAKSRYLKHLDLLHDFDIMIKEKTFVFMQLSLQ